MSEKYSHEIKSEAIAQMKEGMDNAQIGRNLGIPPSTIRGWRKAAGLQPSKKNTAYSAEIKTEAIIQMKQGKTNAEISRTLGVSSRTIGGWRKASGLPPSGGGRKRYSIEQFNDVFDLIREGNTIGEISSKTGVQSSKIKQWRAEEIREGNPLPELKKGVSRRQKYSDEEILELIFLNKGYGATNFRRTLGISSKLFIDICDTWKEIADQDLIEYLNHVGYFTLEEYRRLFDDSPTSYPVIRKTTNEDGTIEDIPVFPSPHDREFSWGDIEEENESNPIIDWIIQRVNSNGYISREYDLHEFVEETGAGKTKFNKWMNRAGLTYHSNSARWYLLD